MNRIRDRSSKLRAAVTSTAALKTIVFTLCALPLVVLVYAGFIDELGANPVEAITHHTGEWALRLLLVTLMITPARRMTGWNRLVRFRRMLGLYAFFYACLHAATYAVLDASLDPAYVLEDVLKRPYITVGFTTFCLLIPLAITSTDAMVRRLGGRRWRALHRLAYVTAGGGVLHFLWLVKADLREPLVYMAVLVVLLVMRTPGFARTRFRWPRGTARGAAPDV